VQIVHTVDEPTKEYPVAQTDYAVADVQVVEPVGQILHTPAELGP